MTDATLREIEEQPAAIEAILAELRDNQPAISDVLSPSSTICLTGCGTSYFLALTGSHLLGDAASTVAIPGGEVLVSPDQLPDDGVDCIIPVSRSGESTETVQAIDALRERYPDASVLGLTCTPGSPLDERSDVTILSPEGAEDSVVMTKSFSSLLVAFEALARLLGGDSDPTASFAGLPTASEEVIARSEGPAEALGTRTDFGKFAFLGTGALYGLASEAMLKLEEMTLSWVKAYHPLEYRHGPKSIVDDDTLVTLFVPDRELELHADLLSDVGDLGATTFVVGPEQAVDAVPADHAVTIPDTESESLALYAPAFQLLGYHRSLALDLDPDEPKNLTQVVRL